VSGRFTARKRSALLVLLKRSLAANPDGSFTFLLISARFLPFDLRQPANAGAITWAKGPANQGSLGSISDKTTHRSWQCEVETLGGR
jgi:hypothetical protein